MTAQVKSSQPTFTVRSESVIRNRNYKITDLFLANISTFEFRKKIPLELFEMEEQLMMRTFSINLTQFEKTGSISKIFISLKNLKIKFHFQNQKRITFLVTFTRLLFDNGVCFSLNKAMELDLKNKIKN